MIYKLYLNTKYGYKKQCESDYDNLMLFINKLNKEDWIIIIEYYEELNMDNVFYSGRVEKFNKMKGKVRKYEKKGF